MSLRNACIYLQVHTASQPRRPISTCVACKVTWDDVRLTFSVSFEAMGLFHGQYGSKRVMYLRIYLEAVQSLFL
jgi:hypothetical protein